MLKQLVQDQLRAVLSDYIYFDDATYKTPGWGNVLLENVRVRETAFERFGLPIAVKSGRVGRLEVSLPIGNFNNKPVQLVLHELYVVAGPIRNFDRDRAISNMRKAKADAILSAQAAEIAERLAEQGGDSSSSKRAGKDDAKKRGSSIIDIQTIIDNIQVSISDLHLRFRRRGPAGWRFEITRDHPRLPETRYEDDDSRLAPELHTAIGLTIRRLTVRTCDEQWKQVWRNVSRGKDGNVSSSSNRQVKCDALAFYSNKKSSDRWSMDLADEINRRLLLAMITQRSGGREALVKHVLEPTSVDIRAALLPMLDGGRRATAEAPPQADVKVEASSDVGRRAVNGVSSHADL